MKTVAFIPARAGSKSIPLKNIKMLYGKPLIQWVLEAASDCKMLDAVFVATDSNEIKTVVENMKLEKVQVISRSPDTASDTATSESVLLEFAQNHDFEHVVFIQATSPLLCETDLTAALNKYFSEGVDSLLSGVRQKRFIWCEDNGRVRPVNYDPLNRPRRQEFEGFLVENGAFYITKKSCLLNSKCRISGNIAFYEMDEESYFEIDEPSDWIIAENLLKCRYTKNINILAAASKIKMVATDSDGVLTDGGMYYSEKGDELKKFNTRDGMGIGLLRQEGIITCIITGEKVDLVRKRAEKLGIDEVHLGIIDKTRVLNSLAEKYKLNLDEIAYIGDDINDIEALKMVGLGCAAYDAMDEVRKISKYVTGACGGNGVLREVAELILRARMLAE